MREYSPEAYNWKWNLFASTARQGSDSMKHRYNESA
jgi:hypothetical protein